LRHPWKKTQCDKSNRKGYSIIPQGHWVT